MFSVRAMLKLKQSGLGLNTLTFALQYSEFSDAWADASQGRAFRDHLIQPLLQYDPF